MEKRQKIFKFVEKSAFVILVMLAFVGTIFLGTIIHELSHWEDYKEIAKDDSICLLDMPADGASSIMEIHGTYYYQYNTSVPGWEEKAKETDRFTELKAYSTEFATIGLLFIVCVSIVFWRRTQESSINYQKIQSKEFESFPEIEFERRRLDALIRKNL